MTQSSRRSPRNMTRRERRTSGVRSYPVPAASSVGVSPRRSYMVEPAPIDHTSEYRFVRKDLARILIWATVLIGLMIVAAVLNLPALLF